MNLHMSTGPLGRNLFTWIVSYPWPLHIFTHDVLLPSVIIYNNEKYISGNMNDINILLKKESNLELPSAIFLHLNIFSAKAGIFKGNNVSIITIMALMMSWAMFQYPIRRFIITFHGDWKLRAWQFKLSHCYEILQAPRQQCCRGACKISERSYDSNLQQHVLSDIITGPWFLASVCHQQPRQWLTRCRCWPLVREIHMSPVNSSHKGQ